MSHSLLRVAVGIFAIAAGLLIIVVTVSQLLVRVQRRNSLGFQRNDTVWSNGTVAQMSIGILAIIQGVGSALVPSLITWSAFLSLGPALVLLVVLVRWMGNVL